MKKPRWKPGPHDVIRQSPYNRVAVTRDGSIVRIRRVENGATVSAIDLEEPTRQLFPSTATLFVAALINPNPKRAFNIGLGAGAFNRLFVSAFPTAALTTIEIDPMIVDIAKTCAAYRPARRETLMIGDGRAWLKRSKRRFDWIVVDAFVRASAVPPHLATMEFYPILKSRLSDGGVFVANFVNGDAMFPRHVKTLVNSFPQVMFFPFSKGRIVACAINREAPGIERLLASTDKRRFGKLERAGVDFSALRAMMMPANEIGVPPRTRILRD